MLSATSRLSASGAKMTNPPRFNLSHLRRSQLRNCLLTLSRDAPISWLMSRCVTLNFSILKGGMVMKMQQRFGEAGF